MIHKLNSELAFEALTEKCDLSLETSENETPVQIEGDDGLKARVANYKKVMLEDFNIPPAMFFDTVPINIEHIRSFLANNGDDLAAARIYLSKKTGDETSDDFELLIVPCRAITNEFGEIVYYEDKLDDVSNNNSGILLTRCRRPPGCTIGALLL